MQFRNQHGFMVEMPEFSATEAKSIGRLLDAAEEKGAVAIRRKKSLAVLLSAEEYAALVAHRQDPLAKLAEEFDALLDGMQTPESRRGVDRFLEASAEDFGRAIARSARPE